MLAVEIYHLLTTGPSCEMDAAILELRLHGAGAHPHTHRALCSLIPSFHDITTNDESVQKKKTHRPHRGYTININKQVKIFNKRQNTPDYLTSEEN